MNSMHRMPEPSDRPCRRTALAAGLACALLAGCGGSSPSPSVPPLPAVLSPCEARVQSFARLLAAAATARAIETALDDAARAAARDSLRDELAAAAGAIAKAPPALIAASERDAQRDALDSIRADAMSAAGNTLAARVVELATRWAQVTDAGGCGAQTVTVERLDVPAGSTLAAWGGLSIHARTGIDIGGRIEIVPGADGRQAGDFELRALDGDLRLNGSIVAPGADLVLADDGLPSVGRPAAKPVHATPQRSARASASPVPAPTPRCTGDRLDGANISLVSARRDLYLGPALYVHAEHGCDALDGPTIVLSSNSEIVGRAGGRGGNIALGAPAGVIHVERPALHPVDREYGLCFGYGGMGENFVIDRSFTTAASDLFVTGGRGGDSGTLVLLSSLWSAELSDDVNSPVERYPSLWDCGQGGRGGWVAWDNSLRGGLLSLGNAGALTETLPLEYIDLQGGRAGDGALRGGIGGFAAYFSARIINRIGTRVADVRVAGGDGGDVAFFPMIRRHAHGGLGGVAMGWGNDGWNGGTTDDARRFTDGAPGGRLIAQSGKGGDGSREYWGSGGAGGPLMEAPFIAGEFRRNERIGVFPPRVMGGKGGDGLANCDPVSPGPGGRGGNSGEAVFIGGDGGAAGAGGWGGDGGGAFDGADALVASVEPGRGGDGQPPGVRGQGGLDDPALAPRVVLGSGGNGGTPGSSGSDAGIGIVSLPGSDTPAGCAPPPVDPAPDCLPGRENEYLPLQSATVSFIGGWLYQRDRWMYQPCSRFDPQGRCLPGYERETQRYLSNGEPWGLPELFWTTTPDPAYLDPRPMCDQDGNYHMTPPPERSDGSQGRIVVERSGDTPRYPHCHARWHTGRCCYLQHGNWLVGYPQSPGCGFQVPPGWPQR